VNRDLHIDIRVLIIAILTTVAAPALAAPIYSYQLGNTTATVNAGQTASFSLFLVESGAPSLITSDGGLNSAGALVQRTTTGASSALSTITGFQLASAYVPTTGLATGQTQGTGGFGFAASGSINNAGNGNVFTFSEVATTSVPLANTGNSITAPSNEIYLGSITITGAAMPGSTNFTLGERGAPNNWTTTASHLDDLDVTNNTANGGGATYTGVGSSTSPLSVTVVPEPVGSFLCCIAGTWFLMRRRRSD
jgi:hypothetical protein